MRTTPDLPDPLMRELKAGAALEGVKLKDFFAGIAQAALQRPVSTNDQSARSPLPVFKRTGAKAMPVMRNSEIYSMNSCVSSS